MVVAVAVFQAAVVEAQVALQLLVLVLLVLH